MEKSLNLSQNSQRTVFATKITLQNLIKDLQALFKEYYVGQFTKDGQSLKLSFYNGQNFKLQIEELN